MGRDKIGSKLKYCHGSDKKIGLKLKLNYAYRK